MSEQNKQSESRKIAIVTGGSRGIGRNTVVSPAKRHVHGAGSHRQPWGAVYASMKGAVEVLSRQMALELGSRRIAVNIVAPDPVASDFSGGVVRDNPAVSCCK